MLCILHHEVQWTHFYVSEELKSLYLVCDYSQTLENGLTFQSGELSNMATNCTCSPTNYHNITWLWFANFKKSKVRCVSESQNMRLMNTKRDCDIIKNISKHKNHLIHRKSLIIIYIMYIYCSLKWSKLDETRSSYTVTSCCSGVGKCKTVPVHAWKYME
jgi:hypothetical protein